MRFQSDTAVFKFLRRGMDRASIIIHVNPDNTEFKVESVGAMTTTALLRNSSSSSLHQGQTI